MIQRAWTLVIGYMLAYGLFPYNFPKDHPGRVFFPKERLPYLIIGYILFLLGFTEVSTWILRKVSQFSNAYFNTDLTADWPWMVGEITFWYFVANGSVRSWTSVGQFYHQNHKKMFAFSVFFSVGSKYFNFYYMDG